MKKVLLIVLTFSVMLLAGCTEATDYADQLKALEDKVAALETSKTELENSVTELEGTITNLENDITELENENTNQASDVVVLEVELGLLESKLDDAEAALETATTDIETLEMEKAALQAEIKVVNDKIKNALNVENWTTRKVTYNADFSTNNEEYCFGAINSETDWSTFDDDDYRVGNGLKFVITVLDVEWGTEIFAQDSCGNYSEFYFQHSPYMFYSMPAGMFEVGKTYEVVLYREVYMFGSPAQVGVLPAADLIDGWQYPTDLSGVSVTEVSE